MALMEVILPLCLKFACCISCKSIICVAMAPNRQIVLYKGASASRNHYLCLYGAICCHGISESFSICFPPNCCICMPHSGSSSLVVSFLFLFCSFFVVSLCFSHAPSQFSKFATAWLCGSMWLGAAFALLFVFHLQPPPRFLFLFALISIAWSFLGQDLSHCGILICTV